MIVLIFKIEETSKQLIGMCRKEDAARRNREFKRQKRILVRGVGPPPNFTGKNMPMVCLTRVRAFMGLLDVVCVQEF